MFVVYDASSKFPSGLLNGRYIDLGDFDECINCVDPSNKQYIGKYCLGEIDKHLNLQVGSFYKTFYIYKLKS